jgi:hypothetical protein
MQTFIFFWGGGGEANAEGVNVPSGVRGAYTTGNILKSRVPEMRFEAFWG